MNRSEIYHEGRWLSPKELFTADMYKEVYIFSQPRVVRSIHRSGGWTARDLASVLEPTFKQHFTPLDNSISFFNWDALL
jgi:hypothetical protein